MGKKRKSKDKLYFSDVRYDLVEMLKRTHGKSKSKNDRYFNLNNEKNSNRCYNCGSQYSDDSDLECSECGSVMMGTFDMHIDTFHNDDQPGEHIFSTENKDTRKL